MLVAADQEGGQFLALGDDATPFAGNMALGAVGDDGLAERVGRAIGLEARAMGVNVVYAPCIDLATNPANPSLGIRSFGDDPAAVARHGVAMVRGLQSAGVAASVKHSPGKGHVASDTHHGLAGVDASRAVLDAREFVPFRAAFAAGVRLAMSGHFALPAVSGRDDLPSTLSRAVMTDLLRGELGFDGVTISDALDMRALAQGPAQVLDIVAAVRAGVDLLLASADPEALARIEDALVRARARDLFDPADLAAADRRIAALRAWLARPVPRPDLSVVGGAEHLALARELAARSITLVRDPAGQLPLRPRAGPTGPRGDAATRGPHPGRHVVARPAGARRRVARLPSGRGRDRRGAGPRRRGDRRRPRARRRSGSWRDRHRHDRRSSPAGADRAGRGRGRGRPRARDPGRGRRDARPVGCRGLPGRADGPRHVLDPAGLARRAGGGAGRPGGGAWSPAGRDVVRRVAVWLLPPPRLPRAAAAPGR